MAGNFVIKNGQDQEFRITHNDNVGAVTIESDKIAVKNDTKKRRNYLINGNFQFWDYGTSQTTAGYGSDNRWNNSNNGSTKTHSRMTSSDVERSFFESPYYSRTLVSSVVGIGNYTQKFQRIEDVTKLAGKTVTLSFWAKVDSNKNIAITISQNFGSGGSPSTYIDIPLGLVSLSTTWKKYTITTTLPSLIGKTLGTDGVHTSHTQISIALEAGSNFNTVWSNLGQQSGTFDIAEVKLEDGNTATDGWAPYDGEWGSEAIARMRYYEVIMASVNGMVHVGNGDYRGRRDSFKVPKRVAPIATLSTINLNGFALGSAGAGVNLGGAVGAFGTDTTGFRVTFISNYANLSGAVGGGDFMYSCSEACIVYLNAEL